MNRANGRIQWFPPTGKIVLYIGHFRSCQSNPILLSSFDDPPPSIGLNLYPQPSATTISPDYSRTATCVGLLDSPPPLRLALLPDQHLARPRFSLVRAPAARRPLLLGGPPQLIPIPLANRVAPPPGILQH